MRCPDCGSEVAPSRLSCPACQQLIHSERLKMLAAEAQAAEGRGDPISALDSWKQALSLLPPGSRQHEVVQDRIDGLERKRVEQAVPGPSSPPDHAGGPSWKKVGVGVGAAALLLWKLKAVLAFVLTKGKLLVFGLAKSGSLLGALASFGVYWAAWGWKFALGLMVSLYLHELGHVFALKRNGVPASAPMFVPGLGAYVRLKKRPPTPQIDAEVGLAGPLWGLAAAAGAYVVYQATGWSSWGAIARFGAWINLFNLLPVWQLDGARGFAALTRGQRLGVVAAMVGMYLVSREGLLLLIALIGGFRVVVFDGPETGDNRAFAAMLALVVLLGLLAGIEVPV